MNTDTLAFSITVKSSPFYLNEYLKPFIDVYLTFKDEVDCPFSLFHKYQFANLNNYFEYFIGFRYLEKELTYFFISLYTKGEDCLEVTGFSTYTKSDPKILELKDFGFFTSKKPIKVLETFQRTPTNDLDSMVESLKKAGISSLKMIQSSRINENSF